MRNLWILAILLAGGVALTACSEGEQQQAKEQAEEAMDEAQAAAGEAMDEASKAADEMDDMADQAMSEDQGGGEGASAKLEAVGDSGVTGEVTFTKVGDGVQVYAEASGLSEGKHAFHIHQNGNCSNNAQAAGGHLKLSTDGDDEIHGNLGEFTVASSGSDSELSMLDVPISEIMGKAVVVHAKGNDPSQPPGGAAGGRIACGVIK